MRTRDDEEFALLLGVLAHRLELAGRDTVVHVFDTWARSRGRSFAATLREGTLPAPTVGLLEDLGNRLAEHAGGTWPALMLLRPGETLGSIDARTLDPQLRSTIARHGDATRTAQDSLSTVVDPDQTRGAVAHPSARFHSLKLHARGGLGEIFVAHDEALGRDVALKEIQPRYADNGESRSRFVREAQITGRLEHPGIVPIYTLGQYPDGRPFYTMRFIDGMTLKHALELFHAEGKTRVDPGLRTIELRRLLARFVDVCNTIHFAHSRGVIHRDIKPANIMLGQFGEAIVVDWGLGKIVGSKDPDEAHALLTNPGTPMGTPAYMSPEQAMGWSWDVGPASDVYSLGATLYFLLTGKSPFEAKGSHDTVLNDVRCGRFPRPREVEPEVSRSLEAVCLKAMAMKPAQRYASAGDLGDDVERWLAGEPVSVLREPVTRRIWRWGRRNRWVATMIGATSVAIVTIFLFSSLLIAPLALCLALVGGSVGAIVGVVQGKAGRGARHGAEFGFRVGTVVVLLLFVLWLAYMAYNLATTPHPWSFLRGPAPAPAAPAGPPGLTATTPAR